ncbi:MAG TPA: polysaccharide biosynthesis C-terminal domain-containing protein [Draconibacterium sp.]|nr:polysaccharide biosynthesis C-terminal domain-containing protein [Draconibacterium sp.]
MKRKFVTNLILLLTLNLLIKPFWILGIDRNVQNLVGDESYGMYFALFNFSLLLNILLDLGITNFNNKNIAQHQFLLKKHLSNIVGLKFMLAVVYAVFSLTVAAVIGYGKVQMHLLLFLIFNQFLISFTLYLRSNISGLHLFRTDSILSVLDRTLMIAICSVLLFSESLKSHFTIEWFVYAQTAAYLLASVITFAIVLHKSGKISIRFSPVFFMAFLRKSYPYALLILLMGFYNRIDGVMLERLLPETIGQQQAGIYAQAFRLLDAVSMFGVLVAGLLLPIFARMIKQGDDLAQMIKLSFTFLFVTAVVVAVSSIFYNSEIMEVLYHSNTEHSSELLGILMTGFIGIATTYVFGTLLTANGSLKQLNIMAFVGMVINVSLNLILIPRYQAFGSAYASLFTQIITAGAQVILAVLIFKLKPNYLFLLKLAAFASVTVILAEVSLRIENWFYGYLFLIAASVFFAFILRLFNILDLYKFIRNR